MRLGIDVDGVLADFATPYRDLFIQTTARDTFTTWPPPCWDFELDAGYTKAERLIVLNQIHTSPNFWSTLAAYEGAVTFLDALHKVARDVADVYFITTRSGRHVKTQTEQWLACHGYPRPTVLIHREGTKGDLARGLGLTAVLDDRPSNLRAIHPTVTRVLKKASWNTEAWDEFRAIDNLMEFFEVLR